jgi:hypothetical protein
MRRKALAIAFGAAALACAPPQPEPPAVMPARDRAQREWERGNQSAAIAELLLVSGRCPATEVERHALLTAAAMALDPSRGARQVDLGANLAARYLTTAPPDDLDGRPMARSMYLIALELGAEPVTTPGCVSADSAAAVLPRADAQSMPERIKVLERELSRLRDELARIRKTLEPSK